MSDRNNFQQSSLLAKVGHEIVGLFAPFEHFEYLDDDVIAARTARGIRFGKQINRIGHLLDCGSRNAEPYDFNEFVYDITVKCRKLGIHTAVENKNYLSIDTITDKQIVGSVIDEILLNWQMHGTDNFLVTVKDEHTIVFSNRFEIRPWSDENIPADKKEYLASPFTKRLGSNGAGLGLYIIGLSSIKGGFDWDISVSENTFSLSLSF